MKVVVIHGSDWEGNSRCTIKVNDEEWVNAGSLHECPEDACLERDLSFVYDIPALMDMAYTAGKNGEPFEVTEIEEDEE
jgi:hypothetical protein